MPARRRGVGHDLLLIAMLSAPLLWVGLANRHFSANDEAYVAEVAREMMSSGDYLVPRLNGAPFLEKPPLHYAAVAIAYHFLGVTPIAARLPSAIAGLLTLGLTYLLGRRLYGRSTGVRAALILPTLYLFGYVTHCCLIDSTLVLFVTGAYLAASYAWEPDARWWAIPAAYASATLSFLSKGFVGPLLIGLGLAAFVVVRRAQPAPAGPSASRIGAHVAGLATLGAAMGAWAIGLARSGGAPFLREAFLANSIGRIVAIPSLTPAHDSLSSHALPWWALAFGLLGNVAPWTPMLLAFFLPVGREGIREGSAADVAGATPAWRRTFLLTIVIVGLVALSLVHQKRGIYLLPLYPLIALLIAAESERLIGSGRWARGPGRWVLALQVAVVSLLLLGAAAIPLLLSRIIPETQLRAEDILATAIMEIVALLAIGYSVGIWRSGDARLFDVIWAQVAGFLVFLLAFLVPRLDGVNSCDSFFNRARVLTETARATPVLAVKNEGVMGLAALRFGRVLPMAIGVEPLRQRLGETSDLYVIAGDPRAAQLPPEDGAQSEIELQWDNAGQTTDCQEPLYLVHLQRQSLARAGSRAR